MAEAEVNVINHLLDVEHQASELITGAQEEADKRIAAYRAQAEAEYKKEYDQIISALETEYKDQTEKIVNKHTEDIAQYKQEVQNAVQNIQAYDKMLDKVLFED